ncbi:MAG: hypothetical protein J6J35_04330 [Alphaproteobacteria bacterium]|nr:hypothetical protein [Alphaproteobacteria bacterium]
MEEKSLIAHLEYMNTGISEICEEHIFEEQAFYHKTYEKIKNASDSLLNNAMRLSRGQSLLIKSTDKMLTLQDIDTLMLKIYQTMVSPKLVKTKEKEIRNYLTQYHINPESILLATPSKEEQYFNAQTLLNHL